jgi:hypothetical protein
MHVKEIYAIFILIWFWNIIDLWFKLEKREKRGEEFYLWILQLNKCYVSTVYISTEMCCPKGKCGCQYFILLTLEKKIMDTVVLIIKRKIRECYAVANAFTIRNTHSLLLYMKCNSRKINRPTKNMTKMVTLLHF